MEKGLDTIDTNIKLRFIPCQLIPVHQWIQFVAKKLVTKTWYGKASKVTSQTPNSCKFLESLKWSGALSYAS